MECQNCFREVSGNAEAVLTEVNGAYGIVMVPCRGRDWICCDGCDRFICNACCWYPESDYCDGCIERCDLYRHLIGIGRIQQTAAEQIM
jgi:hypothetical protein